MAVYRELSVTHFKEVLDFDFYLYMTLVEADRTYVVIDYLAFFDEKRTINYGGFTQAFLHYCTKVHSVNRCIDEMLSSCLKLHDLIQEWTYWCYYTILIRLCYQFKGTNALLCRVIIDTRTALGLEEQCSHDDNVQECVSA